MSGEFKAYGNIQSLLNYSNSVYDYCFYKLFYGCKSLIDVLELSLPAITTKDHCYSNMFRETSITSVP